MALASLTGRSRLPLNPANGVEGHAPVAIIDESRCIGCTKCLPPCPVDAIVGARGTCTRYRRAVHGLRAVRGALPGRLHHHGARAVRPRPSPYCRRRRRSRSLRRAQFERRTRRAAERPAQRSRPQHAARGRRHRARHVNSIKRRESSRVSACESAPHYRTRVPQPFELLVAVILSAQATDKGVNLATRKLFPVARTPEAITRWV